ncbi:transcriptional enhancer factor TEF-5 isoform X2 [Myotis daubentonii]|uniref:transcriptional enhancer factor TEF-5 isoform X2 n=1 Tax=Myotis daubentonii TaxID=98922 RepID=UPI002873D352|nr:transcriptional enhancer factor TEF-5 isoform X2 [Myotis daubentonii]
MKNIWSWSRTSGRSARLHAPHTHTHTHTHTPRPRPRPAATSCPGSVASAALTPVGPRCRAAGDGARTGTHIPNKAASRRRSRGAARRGGRWEGPRAAQASRPLHSAQAPGAPVSLPARRRSYRNSASPPWPDALRGPREPGEREARRSGKRGKGRNWRNKPLGENQTNRVRAGRAQPPGWGGPRVGGGLSGGRVARLGSRGVGGRDAGGWAPRDPDRGPRPRREFALQRERRPRSRPGRRPTLRWRWERSPPAGRRQRLESRSEAGADRRREPRCGGHAPPAGPAPAPRPARPAPSRSPHPPPGSSTQTFRPARSLLRARRLPLASGSFRTFRSAPSPRPPPRDPLPAPRPAARQRPAERPRQLGPGSGCPVGSGPEPRETSTIASNSWTASSSPGEAREDGPEGLDKGLDNDAEGVWSPDIEQSFQEALAIYPPCGRRKIILSDEGKMYGRNELIARYIKLRTGKTRTRKQVSSHIQVLARKKVREYQVGIKAMNLDQVSKDKALQSMASMSSAQIVSASVLQNKFSPPSPLPQAVFSTSSRFWSSPPLLGQQPGPSQDIKPFAQPAYPIQPPLPPALSSYEPLNPLPPAAASAPAWQDRTIASSRLRLLEYSAFMEVQRDPDTTNPAFSDPPLEAVDVRQIYDKFPEKKGGLKELYEKGPPNAFFLVKFWADLNSTIQEGPGAFYGVSSQYSSADSMTISVSTKVCSFGKQVVEKVETEYAQLENGRFVYRIHRSPMCEYMINFIHKLKHLPEKYMMNSVLENFTILQVVTSRDSQETLLVIAFVFEVSTSEHGAQHHVYKLVKD